MLAQIVDLRLCALLSAPLRRVSLAGSMRLVKLCLGSLMFKQCHMVNSLWLLHYVDKKLLGQKPLVSFGLYISIGWPGTDLPPWPRL